MINPAAPGPARPIILGRRALGGRALGLAGLAAALPGAARAQAAEGATILVPGPEGGGCASWAARAAAALARAGHRPAALRLTHLGGPDGVTAANRFATLDGGGGRVLLALPGGTCHARLIGASRARFEPKAWLPLLLTWNGAVLAGRGPVPARDSAALRVAIPSPDAPEAAALALLDLLGVPARPVLGQPEAAFAAGEADVLIVPGPDPVARARALGAMPWYQFASPGETEGAEIPPLPALSPAGHGVLAAVACLQMRAALVMPPLTRADTVASWRLAASRWQEEERARPMEGQPLIGAAAVTAFALLTPPPDSVLDYRNWLERRLGWRAT